MHHGALLCDSCAIGYFQANSPSFSFTSRLL
jgi:hypothetical protein